MEESGKKEDASEEDVSKSVQEVPRHMSRRRFLKVLGAGVLGGAVYTGWYSSFSLPSGALTGWASRSSSDMCAPRGGGGLIGGGISQFGPDDGFASTAWVQEQDLEVVKVTNLDASGEGSLRWAMEDLDFPRLIVSRWVA